MLILNNITKKFRNDCIFDKASINFDNPNKIYAILGDSGSGKTTLFQILFGLDHKYTGEYTILGKDAKNISNDGWNQLRSSVIQIVYQDFKLLELFSVFENMKYSCNEWNNNYLQIIEEILKEMNLLHLKDKKVKQLSGGEKQRLSFARALVNRPKIILLDEPTGNLDDKNTQIILSYIQKLNIMGVMVIIITHDQRVVPTCDVVYHIDHKKITISSTNEKSIKPTEMLTVTTCNVKHSSFTYMLVSMRNNIVDNIFSNLPVMTIFIVFIVAFSFLWTSSIDSVQRFYNGLSSDGVYISSSNYTKKYTDKKGNNGEALTDDGTRICFSESDLQKVKAINGVKKAIVFDSEVTNFGDINGNRLEYRMNKEDFGVKIKEKPSYSNFPNKITFEFKTVSVPKEYESIYNPKGIHLLSGTYPENQSNQLLVPDYYALSLADDIKDVIHKKIELNVIGENEYKIKNFYTIVGVYKSDYENNLAELAQFYLGYRTRGDDIYNLLRSDSSYQRYKNDYINNFGGIDNTIYESKEAFLKAVGTGKGDMLIQLQHVNDCEQVSSDLKKMFPNLKIMSKTELETGELHDSFTSLWTMILVIGTAVSIIFGFIIIFLDRNYIKRRNRELGILFSLGYAKKEIYKILVGEYFILNICNYLIAYLIIFVLYKFFFQYTNYYSMVGNVFTLPVCMLGFFFVMIMTLLSIFFSIRGVKQNNLQKYLR